MSSNNQTSSATWLGNAGFDVVFFFGSNLLALVLGGMVLMQPASIFGLWLLWLWLIEGPHLLATWQRTYFDAQFRRQRPRLLKASLLWLLFGPLVLAGSYGFHCPEAFLMLLGLAALWSFYHAVRQNYGLLALYQRLHRVSASMRQLDSLLLYGIFGLAVLRFLVAYSSNRQALGLSPELSALEQSVLLVLSGLVVGLMALWFGLLLWRRWRGEPFIPGLFAMLSSLASVVSLWLVASHEPLLTGSVTPEQAFMATTLVSGSVHGVQYLALVSLVSRRRAELNLELCGAARLAVSPLRPYGWMVLGSLVYVGLNLLRGAAPIGLDAQSLSAQICLAVYWGLFFHHYWLDQHIWRPSVDPSLRTELGLTNR